MTESTQFNVATLTDKEALTLFVELLKEKVKIGSAFIKDEDGHFTHQSLVIQSGDYETVTAPEAFSAPLYFVEGKTIKSTAIN